MLKKLFSVLKEVFRKGRENRGIGSDGLFVSVFFQKQKKALKCEIDNNFATLIFNHCRRVAGAS
jgi:hypothetical protein